MLFRHIAAKSMHIQIFILCPALFLFGYLTGSISTAIITSRLMNLPDPRSGGSGNPGATNVLRLGGKKAAIITLLGDALKGLLAVLIAGICVNTFTTNSPSWLPAIAGIGAFIGHLYPVFFGFKGGKGVATALGMLLGTAWPVFLLTVLTWLLVAWLFKYSALAALTAFALAPLYSIWLADSEVVAVILFGMTLLIFWRHRGNIQRLISGNESKIGASKN